MAVLFGYIDYKFTGFFLSKEAVGGRGRIIVSAVQGDTQTKNADTKYQAMQR